MYLSFDALGVPAPQGSKRVVRGHLIDANAPRLRPWRALMTEAAITAMAASGHPTPTLVPVAVSARFYFPHPKGHYGTGRNAEILRARAPQYVAVRPDLDKLVRALLDALTGVVWRDDAQVVSLRAGKEYADYPAGVAVVVADVPASWA